MESFRPQKSPGSDRFLGILSSSPPTAAGNFSSSSSPFELDEDDIFSTDTDPHPIPIPNPNPNPNHRPHRSSPLSPFHRERSSGILAALPEESNPQSLHRKTSLSAYPSPSTSPSPSPSSSSSRLIPVIPKPEPFGGKIQHHSAPVNVPLVPRPPGGASRYQHQHRQQHQQQFDTVEEVAVEVDEEDDEMLPPHEIVDRAQRRREPMTTFSVLEGVGRTLKGRDLRRVRNAVWRKTGFLD